MTEVITALDLPAGEEMRAATLELNAAREEIERLQGALSRAYAAHREDVETIGNALNEEAEYREWCSEFDEKIAGLNSRLNVKLPERVGQHVVEVSGMALVPFTYTVRFEAPRSWETDAIEEYARNEMQEVNLDRSHLRTYDGIEIDENSEWSYESL